MSVALVIKSKLTLRYVDVSEWSAKLKFEHLHIGQRIKVKIDFYKGDVIVDRVVGRSTLGLYANAVDYKGFTDTLTRVPPTLAVFIEEVIGIYVGK